MTKEKKNLKFCEGIKNGTKYNCLNYASRFCEDCGKEFCHIHINRNNHECDDSIEGCHSIWKKK